jgi:hypothetical protein
MADGRGFVRDAREQHLGLFEQADPLRLLPFELRFLARRTAPERWLIDLGRNDDKLISSQDYFQVANPEDRLLSPPSTYRYSSTWLAAFPRQRSSCIGAPTLTLSKYSRNFPKGA